MRVFIHSFVVISVLTILSMADECQKIDSCTCKTSSRTISLKTLSSTTEARFHLRDPKKPGTVYYYNPCKEFTMTALIPVTADVIQHESNSYFALGQDNTATFAGDPDKGTLTLTYTHVDSPTQTRTSVFKLVCAPGQNVLEFNGEFPTIHYTFTLKTDLLCTTASPQRFSTKIVLLIVLPLLLVLCLIAGALIWVFCRRGENVEKASGDKFRKMPLSIIQDGFTFRKFKNEEK